MTRKNGRGFRRIWPMIFITSLCLLLYANTYKVTWISDDIDTIVTNPEIRSLWNFADFFLDPVKTTAPILQVGQIYRPLRTLSYAIDYRIWGLRPFGFHLSNILAHIVTACLGYLLFKTITNSPRASFLAALLFAAHPANVESVTWISGRSDLLFAPFLMISFWCFLHSRNSSQFPSLSLVTSYLFFVIALLGKETAIVLPALLLSYDVLVLRYKGTGPRRMLIEYAVFAVIASAYFVWRTALLGAMTQRSYWGGGLGPTLLTMSKCFAIYLRLVFLPSARNLSFDIPISTSPLEPATLGALLLFAGFLAVSAALWRYNSVLGYGMAWFLICLLPVSNIFPLTQIMAERFLYLSTLGVCMGAASLMRAFETAPLGKYGKAGRLLAVVIIFGLGVTTVAKNSVWDDMEALQKQTLEVYPKHFDMRTGLGLYYHRKGRYLDALDQYGEALRASPDNWKIPFLLCYMGDSYRAMGNNREAINFYKSALSLSPDMADAHINLGITYLGEGRIDMATQSFRRAVELDPRLTGVVAKYLGKAYGAKSEDNRNATH